MPDKTYTEDEYNSALAKVSGLETKVAELTTAAEASQVEARVTAARTESDQKVSEIQLQLDAAVLEAEAAKTEREAIVSWLEAQGKAAEEAAALMARKGERVAKVKEVASFPEEYLTANADRFAAMSDEAFLAAIEDWKTIAPKGTKVATGDNGAQIPAVTAMTAASSDPNHTSDVMRDVFDLRFNGIDTRTV